MFWNSLLHRLGFIGGLLLGGIATAMGALFVEKTYNFLTNRLASRRTINLSGTWHARWQTSMGQREVIEAEVLHFTQKGRRIQIKNEAESTYEKQRGYPYEATVTLFDNRHLIGMYSGTQANSVLKGSLYFFLHPFGDHLIGKWVGGNHDHEFASGFGVIAKSPQLAEDKLRELTASAPMEILKSVHRR